MNDILPLLQRLSPGLTHTSIRHLSVIIPAMLAMTGRVTMLGISRWTEKGDSYRTVLISALNSSPGWNGNPCWTRTVRP
jgi:putative transposase